MSSQCNKGKPNNTSWMFSTLNSHKPPQPIKGVNNINSKNNEGYLNMRNSIEKKNNSSATLN
jgi:hypothetical protein